jgi:hypothetical protein
MTDGVYMHYRILAIMPGSSLHGPATDKTKLVHSEFKIKLVDDTAV